MTPRTRSWYQLSHTLGGQKARVSIVNPHLADITQDSEGQQSLLAPDGFVVRVP
jgi:hypothetical protein